MNMCNYCGKILPQSKKRNKFCNSSCSASFNNGKRKSKLDRKCEFCGKITKNSRFCSYKCNTDFWRMERNSKIEENCLVGERSLRKYLMDKYNNKCSKCGWGEKNPVSNTVCLDIHHIDGNAKNNVLLNVDILCPNCHSLTPTYKSVGSGNRKVSTRTR